MISLPPFKLVLPKGLGLEFLKASLSVWSLTSEMGAETPDLVPRSKPSYCSGTEATQLRPPPPSLDHVTIPQCLPGLAAHWRHFINVY